METASTNRRSADVDEDRLVAVLADPNHLDQLSVDEITDLLAVLEGLRARLWCRLLTLSSENEEERAPSEPDSEQLLDVNEAAAILAVTPRWLYDHSDQLPFTRKLAPRTLRFSERELYRWLEARRPDW